MEVAADGGQVINIVKGAVIVREKLIPGPNAGCDQCRYIHFGERLNERGVVGSDFINPRARDGSFGNSLDQFGMIRESARPLHDIRPKEHTLAMDLSFF